MSYPPPQPPPGWVSGPQQPPPGYGQPGQDQPPWYGQPQSQPYGRSPYGQPQAPAWQQPHAYPPQGHGWSQTPQPQPSAMPIVAGILVILAGVGYFAGWLLMPLATLFSAGAYSLLVAAVVNSLVFLAGGVLLFMRKRSGIHVANAAIGIAAPLAGIVTIASLLGLDFGEQRYLAIPLFVATVAAAVLVNINPTRRACLPAGTGTAPDRRSLPVALGACTLTLGIIHIGASVLGVGTIVTGLIVETLVFVLPAMVGGALWIAGKPAGGMPLMLGLGLAVNAANITVEPGSGLTFLPSAAGYVAYFAVYVVTLALIVAGALPATDRAVAAARRRARPYPQQPPPPPQYGYPGYPPRQHYR